MHVSALHGGLLTLFAKRFITNAPPSEKHIAPSLAFFLRHSATGKHLLFDLGVRKDTDNFSPELQRFIKEEVPVDVPKDVVESLREGGIEPAGVETIVLSHLHYDHVGDHTPFTNATFILGPDSDTLLSTTDPSPSPLIAPSSVPTARTHVLSLTDFTHTLASFPHAHDFFNDGSLYVINSPGHVAGHINLLARTSDDGAWIYLSGDTCHDPRLLSGEREIAFEVDHNGCLLMCAHVNKEAAAEHIRRVKVLSDMERVHVLMAHDWEWYERNGGFEGGAGGVFLPGKIPAIGA
ncbi:Metallo-hydrolase/oxidoreductase [Ramaria rubella]|nr:Metallo-hydrolase/oxidoreductase [Ramaria rubella]